MAHGKGSSGGNKYNYMPVAVSDDVKAQVQRLAKAQRRSMSQQAGELLELGLAEYERQSQIVGDVEAGKTQVSPELVRGE